MINAHNPDRLRDALHAIPPDLSREMWVKAGMAFHAGGGSFEDFNHWSSLGNNYNAQDCQSTFRSFKILPGGVGVATLFGTARDYGWVEGNVGHQRQPAIPRPEPLGKPMPGISAVEVWDRCEAATNAHGYIAAKGAAGVPLNTLRVVPASETLRISGQSVAGFLMVPAFAPDGEMQSAQFIPPDGVGKKVNLPGATMKGATFTVGPNVGPAHLCEGIGAAWAVWQATGHRAVCCFGWGNVRRVAEAIREQDPNARLVLVPDMGKEQEAKKIAADVGAAVVVMPDGWSPNSDVADLARAEGGDALALLLENPIEPPKPVSNVHQLANFVDIEGRPKPPRWVIPGFIGHGVTVISGAHGVGKTTALLSLAMTAAGLHGDELLPCHWRHVVYITEDVEQVRRILAGIVGDLNISLDLIRKRLHIVEAVRLDPTRVAAVGTTYRAQFNRTVQGVDVLPLVVLDTKSAVLALENENDNSEASYMMSALKQGFDGLPVWLIGHVAKPNVGRAEVAALSTRGASAIEGDANQTIFLVQEGERRYLLLGKTRFEPRWRELEITSFTSQTTEPDEFGNWEIVEMRWGIAAPAERSRKAATEQATEQRRKDDEARLRQDIRDAVDEAWLLGHPLNRAGIKSKIRRKKSEVVAMIENLLSERWLYEVDVPAKFRAVNSKKAFLVNLTTEEHEAVLAGSALPDSKLVIPDSWKKQAIPPVPDVDAQPSDSAVEEA